MAKKKVNKQVKRSTKAIRSYKTKKAKKMAVKELLATYGVPATKLREQKVLTEIGDKTYFKKDNVALFHGDCRDILARIPADSIDMIFADPPYNLSNDGFTVHAGRRVSVNKGAWDKSRGLKEDFEFHLDWIKACHRVLKPSGAIWISGTYHSIYVCGYALQLLGF